MLRLLLARLAVSVATLLGVGLCLFVLTRSIAGSPATIVLGTEATVQQIQQFNHDHGLDRPVLAQYWDWLQGVTWHFNFGRSLLTGQPVGPLVLSGMPMTFEIVGLAFVFAVLVALPLGIVSATWRGSGMDHLARVIAVVGVSVPGFWIGLMLIRYPAVAFGWFPPGGFAPLSAGIWTNLRSVMLPAFALGIYYVAIMSRMTRSGLIDVSTRDYMRTARALGLGRGRMLAYALKNALVPVVSVGAMSFGYMFGWALVIEYVFNIPGISNALLSAIGNRDFNVVQAVVFIFTLVFILSNLVADMLNAWLNPRLVPS